MPEIKGSEPAVETTDLKSQWEAYRQAMLANGTLDAQARWVKAEGLSREQRAYLLQLQKEHLDASAPQSAEPAPGNAVVELSDYQPKLEVGQAYMLRVEGADQAFVYAGDKDGRAVMATKKGERLLKSKGLDELLTMAEVFPDEFARIVDKAEIKDLQQAA